MAEVAFIWETAPAGPSDRRALRILVDGRDLAEIVGDHERPYADAEGHPNIAGGYAGLDPRQLDRPISEHFWRCARFRSRVRTGGKTVLLGCTCGEPGCWPLMASIEVHPEEVVWRDFEQPHRGGRWSYESFGPFVFDRSRYEQALRSLERAAAG
jgi:hypothetical protein